MGIWNEVFDEKKKKSGKTFRAEKGQSLYGKLKF